MVRYCCYVPRYEIGVEVSPGNYNGRGATIHGITLRVATYVMQPCVMAGRDCYDGPTMTLTRFIISHSPSSAYHSWILNEGFLKLIQFFLPAKPYQSMHWTSGPYNFVYCDDYTMIWYTVKYTWKFCRKYINGFHTSFCE